jgi:NitT/TauT family transport system substrate-binding protein
MNRWTIAALTLTCGLFTAASAGAQQKLTPVNLRLDFFAYGAHAAFAYGIVKGIYAKEGIDLKLFEGNGSGTVVEQIGSGIDRFAYADATTMAKFASKGLPVKMIANYMQISPLAIVFFADKGYKAPKDLEGKKVAFTPGDSIYQSWPAFVRNAGIDPAKVHIVLLDSQTKGTAVVQNVVDAAGGYYITYVPIFEAQTKRQVSYFQYSDYGVSTLANGIVINTKYLSDRDLNCLMLKATSLAFAAAMTDPDGAAQALHQLFPKAGGGNAAVLEQTWKGAIPLVQSPAANGKPLGFMAPQDWVQLIAMAKDYAGLSLAGDPSFYYTNQFIGCD